MEGKQPVYYFCHRLGPFLNLRIHQPFPMGAFKVPYGFTCETKEMDNSGILFMIDDVNWGTCTLTSQYANDLSVSDFDEVWESWKDPDLSACDERVIDSGKNARKGNISFYKKTAYNVDGNDVTWYFTMIFNGKVHKTVLLSFYYMDNTEGYVDAIINSIRFE